MRGRRVAWTILWRSGRCDLSSNLSDPILVLTNFEDSDAELYTL